MTGRPMSFLETLALRSAGFAPTGDIVSLLPRPRARFERGVSELSPGGAIPALEQPTPQHPRQPAAIAEPSTPLPAGQMAPFQQPLLTPAVPKPSTSPPPDAQNSEPGERLEPGASATVLRDPGPASTDRTSHDLPETIGPRVSAPVAVPPVGATESPIEARVAVTHPEQSTGLMPPMDGGGGRAPKTGQAPAARTGRPAAPEALVHRHSKTPDPFATAPVSPPDLADTPPRLQELVGERSAQALSARDETPPPRPVVPSHAQVALPEPNRRRGDPPSPAVSVTIGRIEVEVAPPPVPPAPVARPASERTRGFDAYTRARRGYLR